MARTRGKVVDKDNGWKKFRKTADAIARGPGVTAGVHAAQGSAAKKERGKGESSETVLDVAIANEFGFGVPERSFIRAWFDLAKEQNLRLAQAMLVRVMKGQIPLETALAQMGAKFVGDVQKRIAQGVPPPNAPATIARKGSSKPLIDTGQLRQSITFAVLKRS